MAIHLRQLKRAAVTCKDMLRFYIAVVRPVLGYTAPVWHTGLTAELAESLESVQKRTLRVIFGSNSFRRTVCHHKTNTSRANPCTKFDDSTFSHSIQI